AEAGQDVVAQVAAVGGPLGGAGEVAGLPDRHPLGQADAAERRVEVGVEGLFDVDLLAAQLGGGAGRVARVGADAAVGYPYPHAVAGAALFYPGHGLLPFRTWSSRSGGCTLRLAAGGKSLSRTVDVDLRRPCRPTAGRAEPATIAVRSVGEKRRCLPRNVH